MSEPKNTGGVRQTLGILAVLLIWFFLLWIVPGCSTIKGVGHDLSDLAGWTAERIDNGFNRPSRPE